IVPFMFVYAPELLMIGEWPAIIWASLSATIGVLLFSAGLHGYFITHSAHWQSVLLVVAGLLLIDPHFSTDVIGAVLAAVVVAAQFAARRAHTKVPKAEIAVE
ncbi:MAG TPA: DUF3394 domain-containing protein, partial [Pseudolabrys sp.]|nr:DUF3394 domain-containing protein [Pseudolabrys sp.]